MKKTLSEKALAQEAALCGRWSICRGCRAIAYAYSQTKGENNFLAEDPQCFISG